MGSEDQASKKTLVLTTAALSWVSQEATQGGEQHRPASKLGLEAAQHPGFHGGQPRPEFGRHGALGGKGPVNLEGNSGEGGAALIKQQQREGRMANGICTFILSAIIPNPTLSLSL